MNKIKLLPILISFSLQGICIVLSFFIGRGIYDLLPPNNFQAILTVIFIIPVFFLLALIIFRIFSIFFPIKPGEVIPDSRQELISNVHICYFLVLFDPVFRNPLLSPIITTPLYQLLGARLGDNTYSNGVILDPSFVSVGKNTALGMDCVLIPHALEGTHLAYYPIEIGDNVTIGTRALIHAGVKIGNGAIIGSGAVVPKNVQIGENEIWGGVPARFIKKREAN